MTKTEKATQWMEQTAADNSHGYSQASRWGPDYDCSSMVISAWEQAGVPVKTKGATYTGNMRGVFLSCGFKNVTSSVNLVTGSGIQRGDVLLNDVSHTAMSIGNGRIVHARSSEGNAKTGDQSGNEIRTQSYWNYPWDCVLRYPDSEAEETTEAVPVDASIYTLNDPKPSVLLQGSVGSQVSVMQNLLNIAGDYGLEPDGEFGPLTEGALMDFQIQTGLEADGIAGTETKRKLKEWF